MDIAAAFEAPPDPLDFVLPGLLAGTVGAIVSPGGVGKSMFALETAAFVSCGIDLLGFKRTPKTGSVVIFSAEDHPQALAHRVHAMGKRLEKKRDEVSTNLEIRNLFGRHPDVMDERWFTWICTKASGRRLIVLDTLRRFHRLDENSSRDMAILMTRLETIAARTGCSLLFLHHTSKASGASGQGDTQQASRGSTVLVDHVRWQAFLSSTKPKQANGSDDQASNGTLRVRWGVPKQNYGPPLADVLLRREQDGVLMHESTPAKKTSTRARTGATHV